MRLVRAAFKFRVELTSHKPRMVHQLYHLYQRAVRRRAAQPIFSFAVAGEVKPSTAHIKSTSEQRQRFLCCQDESLRIRGAA